MEQWHKTSCVLCAQNCGLEVLVADNRMVRARPDKDNVRSQGYACRKGLNVAFYQHHADRLSCPLKKVGDSSSASRGNLPLRRSQRNSVPRWIPTDPAAVDLRLL